MIVERFVAHYACANCDALFMRLSTANEHVRNAHMRDCATQHEVLDCATEASFNDTLLTAMSESSVEESVTEVLRTPTRKRHRNGNRTNKQKEKKEKLSTDLTTTKPSLVEGEASTNNTNSVEKNALSTCEERVKTLLCPVAVNRVSQQMLASFTEARVDDDSVVNDAFSKVRYGDYRFVTIRRSDTRHYYR